MKCILPYSKCVYSLSNGDCSGRDRPNSEHAKCYRVSGKKKMITRARVKSTVVLYEPLQISVVIQRDLITPVMRVYVGKKEIAMLIFIEKNMWHLTVGIEANNELDAVEATLKYLGYK